MESEAKGIVIQEAAHHELNMRSDNWAMSVFEDCDDNIPTDFRHIYKEGEEEKIFLQSNFPYPSDRERIWWKTK